MPIWGLGFRGFSAVSEKVFRRSVSGSVGFRVEGLVVEFRDSLLGSLGEQWQKRHLRHFEGLIRVDGSEF